MRRDLLVTLLTVSLATVAIPSTDAHAQSSVKSAEKPLYENPSYGFRVKLASGLTYTRTLPPNPDHGFGIALSDQGKLWVDASYTDSSSTDEEARMLSTGCQVEEKRPTKLGNRAALALRFSCPESVDGSAYTELLVLTIYQEGDRAPVDYQVGMRADAGGLAGNKDLFEKIVAGFSFKNLAK